MIDNVIEEIDIVIAKRALNIPLKPSLILNPQLILPLTPHESYLRLDEDIV